MKCQNCETEIPDISAFCPICGVVCAPDAQESKPFSESEADSISDDETSTPWAVADAAVGGGAVSPLLPSQQKKSSIPKKAFSVAFGIIALVIAIYGFSASSPVSSGDTAVKESVSESAASANDFAGTTLCEFSGILYHIPSSWIEIKNDDGSYCYKPNDHTGANMVVSELEGDPTFSSGDPELVLQALADALIDAGVKSVESSSVENVDGVNAYRFSYIWYDEDDQSDRFEMFEDVVIGNKLINVAGVCDASDRDGFGEQFTKVLDSITLA